MIDEIMYVAAMIAKNNKMEKSVTSVPAILNKGCPDNSANRGLDRVRRHDYFRYLVVETGGLFRKRCSAKSQE